MLLLHSQFFPSQVIRFTAALEGTTH